MALPSFGHISIIRTRHCHHFPPSVLRLGHAVLGGCGSVGLQPGAAAHAAHRIRGVPAGGQQGTKRATSAPGLLAECPWDCPQIKPTRGFGHVRTRLTAYTRTRTKWDPHGAHRARLSRGEANQLLRMWLLFRWVPTATRCCAWVVSLLAATLRYATLRYATLRYAKLLA